MTNATASVTETRDTTLAERVDEVRRRLEVNKSLLFPLKKALGILAELQTFPLGQHLLMHGSIDGRWTKYCVADQALHRKTVANHNLGPLEDFILNETMRATQERFDIFRQVTQARLHETKAIASIPCGFMDDLLSLDYEKTPDIRRVGLDVDPQSIQGALANAKQYGLKIEAYVADAWDLLAYTEQFDLVTSNGLNIYVPDREKELALYRSFASVLKPGGYLITSFLTPPPGLGGGLIWCDISISTLLRQKLIFADVLDIKWQVFRTEKQMREALGASGFDVHEIIYDRRRMFPTIVATRL